MTLPKICRQRTRVQGRVKTLPYGGCGRYTTVKAKAFAYALLAMTKRKVLARERLNQSSSAAAESFAPAMQFKKQEIHTVFLCFLNFYPGQNLLASAPTTTFFDKLGAGYNPAPCCYFFWIAISTQPKYFFCSRNPSRLCP